MLTSFVRGETEWDALEALGARLKVGPARLHMEETADTPVYEPSAIDVATGLLAHWEVGATLQDWARVLLATGMIDLSRLEDHPHGEVLLGAIWDAAEGTDINDVQLEVARQVAISG